MNDLRAPTYAESVSIETYKQSAASALTDANAFADKVSAAAVSIATAYGAVIALISPKDSVATLASAGPFVPLAVAVGLSLFAHSRAVSLDETDSLDAIRQRVADTAKAKRLWAGLGLLSLAAGMVWAGVVVHEKYGEPAEDKEVTARVWLTKSGRALLASACGKASENVRGTVEGPDALAAKRVALTVSKKGCPDGSGTIMLPQGAIAVARLANP